MIFWKIKEYDGKTANEYADNNDITKLTTLVNGGSNGLQTRETYTNNLMNELKKIEK